MTQTIVLIGPICAGKSTIAGLLAERLGQPRVELDAIRWPYYEADGFDHDVARQIVASDAGMVGFLNYCKPFEAAAVERVVVDHPGSIIDFGAGHSVYDDATLFARVQRALAPVKHVVLLLPSPNADESIRLLNARFAALLEAEVGPVDPALLDLNAHFVRHPSNARLATHTIYTLGQSPEATCAAVATFVQGA